MKNEEFVCRYSAARNEEAKRIREKYMPREKSTLEQLKELDARVRRPASVFAYVYGSLSAIVMGAGMSLVMTDIAEIIGMRGEPMIFGIAIGVAGMALALLTYPIYKGILKARKRKYGAQVLELSEQITNP